MTGLTRAFRGRNRAAQRARRASPYLDLAATVATGWMWLLMAAHADPAKPGEAIKPAAARFFTEHALSGCDGLARQAKAGAATVDLPSADQLRAW